MIIFMLGKLNIGAKNNESNDSFYNDKEVIS